MNQPHGVEGARGTNPTGQRSLGFWMATALVVGNMIGSGVFLLPSSLAPFGAASLLGWGLSVTGALLLAGIYAHLGRHYPRTGGPYTYSRLAFGELAGFATAWLYWVSIWCGNAAIAVAFASYAGGLVPALTATPVRGAITALAAVWLCTAFNLAGLRSAGWVQLVTTVGKLLPLFAIAVVGAWWLDPGDYGTFNRSGEPLLGVATATAALTMWAMLGIECATIPAEDVSDADRNVPRATLLGTVLAAGVTVLACTVVIGLLPGNSAGESGAPFAEAAAILWGPGAGKFFAAAAAVACFGALNGWTLMQGQIPMAAARDGVLPAPLARRNRHGTPAVALVFSSTVTTVLVIANFQDTLVALFTWAILLSTAAVLVPYLLNALAFLKLGGGRSPGKAAAGVLACGFSLWALIGTGTASLFWGAVLLVAGLPVYIVMRARRQHGEK